MVTEDARVLVADTDAQLRRELYKALLDLDLFSDSVADGETTLAKLKERRYSLVVLDLSIPDVAPREILDFLRSLPNHEQPIVIAVSPAGARQPLDHEIVQIVLRKPLRISEVAAMIRSCVRGSRGRGKPDGGPPMQASGVRR